MQTQQKLECWRKLALSLFISGVAVFASSIDGKAAEVAIERSEFVTLMTNVKMLKESLSNADRQITLYKKLDADQKRLIVVHSERIKELETYIASSGKLADEFKTTMENTELVLDEADRNLAREKRLSRYKTYAIVGGVLVWLLW